MSNIKELARAAKIASTRLATQRRLKGNLEAYRVRSAIPVAARDARLAYERLRFAVAHPTRHGTCELGIETAAALLANAAHADTLEIEEDTEQ